MRSSLAAALETPALRLGLNYHAKFVIIEERVVAPRNYYIDLILDLHGVKKTSLHLKEEDQFLATHQWGDTACQKSWLEQCYGLLPMQQAL